jgi:hypothetical protein
MGSKSNAGGGILSDRSKGSLHVFDFEAGGWRPGLDGIEMLKRHHCTNWRMLVGRGEGICERGYARGAATRKRRREAGGGEAAGPQLQGFWLRAFPVPWRKHSPRQQPPAHLLGLPRTSPATYVRSASSLGSTSSWAAPARWWGAKGSGPGRGGLSVRGHRGKRGVIWPWQEADLLTGSGTGTGDGTGVSRQTSRPEARTRCGPRLIMPRLQTSLCSQRLTGRRRSSLAHRTPAQVRRPRGDGPPGAAGRPD